MRETVSPSPVPLMGGRGGVARRWRPGSVACGADHAHMQTMTCVASCSRDASRGRAAIRCARARRPWPAWPACGNYGGAAHAEKIWWSTMLLIMLMKWRMFMQWQTIGMRAFGRPVISGR